MLLKNNMSGKELFWKPKATMACRAKKEEEYYILFSFFDTIVM